MKPMQDADLLGAMELLDAMYEQIPKAKRAETIRWHKSRTRYVPLRKVLAVMREQDFEGLSGLERAVVAVDAALRIKGGHNVRCG